MKLLLPIIVLLYLVHTVTSSFCYWNTRCPYKYFSNRTPYSLIRGDIRDSVVKFAECEPVSIWGLSRHGKRNPGKSFGIHMKEALKIRDLVIASYINGNSSLCAQDIDNLRKWDVDEEMFDKPFQLTKEGYQESKNMARRLKQAFPKLLSKLDTGDYNVYYYKVGEWLKESAKGFEEGITNNKKVTIEPQIYDFDVHSCEKYVKTVFYNPETYVETEKFLSSAEYLASKGRIQRRLGVGYALTEVNITALYDLCRYTSTGLENSPWCAFFTTEDLKVMEYIVDLKDYYRSGYGSPLNEFLGRFVLADLLKSFQAAKHGNGKRITSYISHATIMNMAFTALKLFDDSTPLTGAQIKPYRKWKSREQTTFSSNLMVTLNKCRNDDDYNVVFYLNEEPLTSICNDGVCTWKEFENKLSPFLETNTEICKFTNENSTKVNFK